MYLRARNSLKFGPRCFPLAALGILWAVSGPTFALSSNDVATQHVTARLISELSSLAPGQSVWVILDLDIREGWHTYWRNPGDSGLATQLTWSLPPGFAASDIQWSAPHRFDLAPLVNFGYSGHAEHLVKITAPAGLQSQAPVTLSAKATWLVCSTICIPESAQLRLRLPTTRAMGTADPAAAGLFSRTRGELPVAAPGTTTAGRERGRLTIRLNNDWGGVLSQITALTFFPYDEGVADYAAPQTLARTADGLELTVTTPPGPPRTLQRIRGVLIATQREGAQSVREVPYEVVL